MKQIILSLLILTHLALYGSNAHQDSTSFQRLLQKTEQIDSVLNAKIKKDKIESIKHNNNIAVLQKAIEALNVKSDSIATILNRQIKDINTLLEQNHRATQNHIEQVEDSSEKLFHRHSIYAIIAIIVILLLSAGIYFILHKRISNGTNTIGKIKDAQDNLQKAHLALQEEAIRLDGKLLEILDKQVEISKARNEKKPEDDTPDHSLVLKVADEIVRIELNLSRMDPMVRGYKQLAKAVERIKNNFLANDYEIVDMLGKPYTEGLKAIVTFITDENLEEGQKMITKIIRPQINYKQGMIQSAQIEVSQSE